MVKTAQDILASKKSISSYGGGRPNDSIQKQIEQAHNAGNFSLRDKLIKKLPKDIAAGMTYSSGRATVDPVTHKIIIK